MTYIPVKETTWRYLTPTGVLSWLGRYTNVSIGIHRPWRLWRTFSHLMSVFSEELNISR